MDAQEIVRIAITLVTPILTAGLGIAALAIGDWRERRTQAGRRKLAFEDASRQVAFAAEWWNASKLVAGSPDAEQHAAMRAQTWLDEASALVADYEAPPVDERPTITLRRLLLVYPMQSRSARILRGAFYFFLGLMLFQVGSSMGSALGRPDTLGVPNYFSEGLIYGDLIAIFIFTMVAMALRFGALRVEASVPTAPRRSRLTVRSALLLYKFKRPTAAIARIVFWIWTGSTILIAILSVLDAFEDPRLLPGLLVSLVVFVAWAVGLRYWAISLNARTTTEKSRASSATTTAAPPGG